MGINSKDVDLNIDESISHDAALKEKPMAKAQIKELKRCFNDYSQRGDIRRANNACNALPISEQHMLDKSQFYRALIEQNEIGMIGRVLDGGVEKDIGQLKEQYLKVAEQEKLAELVDKTPLILKSTRKYHDPNQKQTKQSHYFSSMKNKFKKILARSAAIQPQEVLPLEKAVQSPVSQALYESLAKEDLLTLLSKDDLLNIISQKDSFKEVSKDDLFRLVSQEALAELESNPKQASGAMKERLGHACLTSRSQDGTSETETNSTDSNEDISIKGPGK